MRKIARECFKTGRDVRSIVLERGDLTEEQLNRILHPREMTEPGIAGGGSPPFGNQIP